MGKHLLTPYEQGNKNQTTTYADCLAFYLALEQKFPQRLRMSEIGRSDAGNPVYAGVLSADGVFDRATLQQTQRPIFFNNNGIHPGEPEGIDACMALIRDLCMDPELDQRLGKLVVLFIPVYNVDGCLNRNSSSRVNQDGPLEFGFRGNALHLDLNRDFIKCDSSNAQVFNRFFAEWDPDLMVDTHTSNGADYAYTMTVIATQPDKLGGAAGEFIRNVLTPEVSAAMHARGWDMCPYVNPIRETPDDGIEDFLDTPRFSTGYAALHGTIGFMPETHMLKSFQDRYESMLAYLTEMMQFCARHAGQIRALRQADRNAAMAAKSWDLCWETDFSRPEKFLFRGYAAGYRPSELGNYSRLYYDRNLPYEKEIDWFNHCRPTTTVAAARCYVVPQQWHQVIERLRWNGVVLEVVAQDRYQEVETYHVVAVQSRSGPYEGHMFHNQVELETRTENVLLRAGDLLVPAAQPRIRYAVETLEPMAHDSFFRWGFFNSILEKKETYSNYVFEDTATTLIARDPTLRAAFEQWKSAHPELCDNQNAVLDFIFFNCRPYQEPEWRRYPVFRIVN